MTHQPDPQQTPAHRHHHDENTQHPHDHDHDHHAPTATAGNAQRLLLVLCLTAGYAGVQVVGGIISGSLALIADAGHMLSDAAALLLALIAYKIAARAPDATHTYGYHRVRVLAALANGVALLALVVWIVLEAIARFNAPVTVLAGPMLVVAVIGLLVNIIGALILLRGGRQDANLRGALLHVIGDLLGSLGAIAAAIGIMLTGYAWLDPLLSVLVALLLVRAAWRLVSESTAVLMQRTPKGLDIPAIEQSLLQLPDIAEVRHFHAWTLTDDTVIASIHVSTRTPAKSLELPAQVQALLAAQFHIQHLTVQVDPPASPTASSCANLDKIE